MKKSRHLNIEVTPQFYTKVKIAAAERSISLRQLISEAIEAALKK